MNQISLQRNRVRVEKKTRTRLRVLREDAQANAGWAVSSEIKRWISDLVAPAVSTRNWQIEQPVDLVAFSFSAAAFFFKLTQHECRKNTDRLHSFLCCRKLTTPTAAPTFGSQVQAEPDNVLRLSVGRFFCPLPHAITHCDFFKRSCCEDQIHQKICQ
jgi:hypothetical protein